MSDFRMPRRINNAINFYIGSYGNVQMDRDTGAERHQMRFDIGNYISRDNIQQSTDSLFQREVSRTIRKTNRKQDTQSRNACR